MKLVIIPVSEISKTSQQSNLLQSVQSIMANLQVIENEGEDGSQRHTEVYLPSFEVQIQQEVADMKGVKVSDETQITAA